MGFLKNLAKNGIKNIVIKGMCLPTKSVYADVPCEVALESIADSISERVSRNVEIKAKQVATEKDVKWNMCERRYPKKQKDSIDVIIISSARKSANGFQHRYPRNTFFAGQNCN